MAHTPSHAVANSVVELLKEDHEKVKGLFAEYEEADSDRKQDVAETALQDLEVHAELEEKLIYPAVREAIDDDALMNEAIEEHHLVHVSIKELKKLKPGDAKFDAKFKVLGELVKHHIQEEEGEMLPQAEEADIDWDVLGAKVMKRREQLLSKTDASARGGGKRKSRS
ncbi:MAG TPA: hemerythrin domain-containing protein [Nitrospiraceae bacterium]|nr:hemerythrin domain-containing protein [Nitrospiraceae bacterium]